MERADQSSVADAPACVGAEIRTKVRTVRFCDADTSVIVLPDDDVHAHPLLFDDLRFVQLFPTSDKEPSFWERWQRSGVHARLLWEGHRSCRSSEGGGTTAARSLLDFNLAHSQWPTLDRPRCADSVVLAPVIVVARSLCSELHPFARCCIVADQLPGTHRGPQQVRRHASPKNDLTHGTREHSTVQPKTQS